MTATVLEWPKPGKKRYGEDPSYRLGAAWLRDCAEVADWGCGGGRLRHFLPPGIRYVGIDGTPQPAASIVADLAALSRPSEGIMLRHVVDNTPAWRSVLRAAVASFTRRLAVVTYTPDAMGPSFVDHEDPGGWPVWHLSPKEVREEMGALLVRDALTGVGPERIYFLERA